jgi:H+-transporting ATPase
MPEEWKELSVEETAKRLDADLEGLSSDDIPPRLEKYGRNEIVEKKVNPLVKFLKYFWGPIPWMIEGAAILSAVVRHWEDFWIITILLLLNAGVGFWQERKADNAIELLKQKLALRARVRRDGKWQDVPAAELLPGDLVRVRAGEIVPADLKLVDGDFLQADESALTGESLPVEKQVSDIAYSGSVVRQGEMNALVTATGMDTFFGRTARLVEEARTVSHFQKAVVKIGDYLIVLAIALVVVIFLVSMYRHESLLETLQFALVLTVAAIPAALPAVLSVTMVVGASALAKRQAIVSKLVAIEEMAGMDILCSDKTGTITQNRLNVAELLAHGDFDETDVLLHGLLASKEENRDPIEMALFAKADETGDLRDRLGRFDVTEFKPFDPVVKRTEATVRSPEGESFKVVKGAPQVVLSLVKNGDADEVMKQVDELASKGYRALGVAREGQGKWTFVGLIALFDPPREDSADTIRTAVDMGVRVKMVTGDHAAIAREVAGQVGMGTDIKDVETFLDKPERQAERAIESADGFAQVFPEHKFHIVELLQKAGHIVGMTGDGVNDAPALKKADAGIAVDGATDAAKSAAAIVLTEPGLSVIIDAIKSSREVFQRMNSYAIYRITETIRVLFFITLSIIVFNFYPVTAVMIVLLALFNDAPIMAIAYDKVRYGNAPEKWNMRTVLGVSTLLGLVGVVSSFGIFYIAEVVLKLTRDQIQAFVFLKLAVAGHLTIFLTRTKGPFWSIRPSGALFFSAVITKLLATLLVVYGWYVSPIGWKLAGYVWAYAFAMFVITDLLKVRFLRLLDHTDIRFHR